jgi:membrane protease YdiL (CAAX protease family)
MNQKQLDEVNKYECHTEDRSKCCKSRARPYSREYRGRTYCSDKPTPILLAPAAFYFLRNPIWGIQYTSRSIIIATNNLRKEIYEKGLRAGTQKLLQNTKITAVSLMVTALSITTQFMCTAFFQNKVTVGLAVFRQAVGQFIRTDFVAQVRKAFESVYTTVPVLLGTVLGPAEEYLFREILPTTLEHLKPAMFRLLDKYYKNGSEEFKEKKVQKWFKILYLVICSVMFGLYHYLNGNSGLRSHCQVIFCTVIGFFFHWIRDKAGLQSAVAMHFIHNLTKGTLMDQPWLNKFIKTGKMTGLT